MALCCCDVDVVNQVDQFEFYVLLYLDLKNRSLVPIHIAIASSLHQRLYATWIRIALETWKTIGFLVKKGNDLLNINVHFGYKRLYCCGFRVLGVTSYCTGPIVAKLWSPLSRSHKIKYIRLQCNNKIQFVWNRCNKGSSTF